ncbi:hypothetical protein AL755_18110 [Arthrobacter sp. ERGS1:01]|uniref:hypothetical protein n=1 Tax=Arthrobacter sp. ERGS1:01 TaxID=1704044 RepID=UPI0006B676E3|nr:hypothetical protein [Arthrobacter sp. ERGS1:01]ALE06927.1 hypothetical protein AL755_18110 [Arthrobacter sp. ERGS1:01]
MPQEHKPLSDLQSKVLKWVNDGCPDGVFEGYSHRISARALADDRYITITGKGPTWAGKITKRGREVLEGVAESDSQEGAVQSEADKFIQRLETGGGVHEVEGGYHLIAANEALIRSVMKSALRPKGYRLEIADVGSWQKPKHEARWVRHFPDDVELRPVPVPETVGKYHAVAKEFRERKSGVSKEHVARASKLLHAVAAESESRGYEVAVPSSLERPTHRGTRTLNGDIAIASGTTTIALEIRELPPNAGAARPYILSYNHSDRSRKLVVNPDFVSTGRLQLELTEKYSTNGRPERYRDGKRQTLDHVLPAILRELEIQHLEHEWSKDQARIKEEAIKRRWEAAMERARVRIQDHHKAKQLTAQANTWAEVGTLRRYVDAVEVKIVEEQDNDLIRRGQAWLDWMRKHIDAKDPLLKPIEIPVLLEYPDDDLTPFLDGWSPHGPRGAR